MHVVVAGYDDGDAHAPLALVQPLEPCADVERQQRDLGLDDLDVERLLQLLRHEHGDLVDERMRVPDREAGRHRARRARVRASVEVLHVHREERDEAVAGEVDVVDVEHAVDDAAHEVDVPVVDEGGAVDVVDRVEPVGEGVLGE